MSGPFHAMAEGCAAPPISARVQIISAYYYSYLLSGGTVCFNSSNQLCTDLAQGCCLITLDHHEATAIRGDVERRFLAFSSVGTRKQPSRRPRPKAGTCLHGNIHQSIAPAIQKLSPAA